VAPLLVMFRLKHWIKNFFGFSRSQVNGFILLLLLATILLFSEPFWRWQLKNRPLNVVEDKIILDSLVAIWDAKKPINDVHENPENTQLFHFNPNNATIDNLIKLGFSRNVAPRIVRYREKGGKFRTKSDLLKIYGIDSTFYHRIYAFIDLPEKHERTYKPEKKLIEKEAVLIKKSFEKFDLNSADTAQLKKIYGIGEKLSMRIIKYRDVLGGFVSTDQLKEVYGLDSTVINRLVKNSEIKHNYQPLQININTATEKELSGHPYLSKAAKAIVSYRFQHGAFKTVSEIRNINALDEKIIQKVTPYLKVDDEL
jgi:competence protein ComEA